MALFEDYLAFIANYNISSGQFTVVLSVLVIVFIFYSALLNNQHLIIKVLAEMLTPAFTVEQDSRSLTFHIKVPFAKIADTEVYIDGYEFKFYSKPYYLRLNLPGEIESDSDQAKYVADERSFMIKVDKENAGEHFEGLDLLTKLLAPAGSSNASGPLIEVIDSNCVQDDTSDNEDEQFDWQIEQELYSEVDVSAGGPTYGFAGQKYGLLGRMQSELHDVIDLKDADKTPKMERRTLRMQDECDHFDDEHYLADLYEDEAIQPLLKYKPPWEKELKSIISGKSEELSVKITDEEREKMLKLPRKEYLLNKMEERSVMLNLVDILFSYAYDQRTNEGDSNVESPWTICKLSGTLSWFQQYMNVEDVIIICVRRCLTYPLHRHYKLTKKVLKDTCSMFKTGRRRLLKSLLHIHSLLQSGDNTYVLNDLYITDYCIWIQHVREKHIKSMANALEKVKIAKGDIGLDLIELERAAELVLEEKEQSEQMHQQDDERSMMDRLTEVSVNNEEDQLVAEATSSMQCLHIVTDDPHSNHGDGENCTCNKTGSLKSAANVPTMCEYCSKHNSKCSRERGGGTLSEVRDDSGTEDSSLSSETPSDSSDTSDSSDSSTDSSDTEELDKEPQSDINKMGNVQLRE